MAKRETWSWCGHCHHMIREVKGSWLHVSDDDWVSGIFHGECDCANSLNTCQPEAARGMRGPSPSGVIYDEAATFREDRGLLSAIRNLPLVFRSPSAYTREP